MTEKTRIYKDLNVNFIANPITGDVYKTFDEDAIKSSLKSLILTNNGERPFHSEIGSPIRNLLFENYTPMLAITLKRAIANMVAAYEPRVQILEIAVDPNEDQNEITLGILFKIKNTDTSLFVSVTLDRTR
jgi:phage baseplate assembly protein W